VLSDSLKNGGQKLVIGETTLAEIIKWGNDHALDTKSVPIRNPAGWTIVIRVVAAQDGCVVCEHILNQGTVRKVLREDNQEHTVNA
jgi:hypothetical protein